MQRLCTLRLPWSRLGLIIILGVLLSPLVVPRTLAQGCAPGEVVYVDADATGANTGTSWADAFTDLQDAVDAISSGEIWVAAGTYMPSRRTDAADVRSATFMLKNCVALYGGFVGDETVKEQRDWVTNETILSGDIGVVGDNMDNSYHVVTSSGTDDTAVLDGFTITAGYANGRGPSDPCTQRCGGGMYIDTGSPTLAQVIFIANRTESRRDGFGGGLYNVSGSPLLTQVIFSDNSARVGGGLYNVSGSPLLTQVIFSDNSASHLGGGLLNGEGSPVLTQVTFSGNSADNGGGMYTFGGGSPTLTQVTFHRNYAAKNGGGMQNASGGLTLQNSIMWRNNPDDTLGSYSGHHNLISERGDPDPRFVDATNGDLRLQSGSPAIDVGSTYWLPADTFDLDGDGNTTEPLPVDLDGQARVVDGDGDGVSQVDMGAYEFCPSDDCPPAGASFHLASFVAETAPQQVTLKWQTATEPEVAGFHVYRATGDAGAFERLTDTPIPAQGNATAGAVYEYVDLAGSGHYVYQLVSVDAAGVETARAQAEAEVTAERRLFVPMLQR